MARRIDKDATGVVTFDRKTFRQEVFFYTEGDCVTCLAPMGGGKTQLMLELIGETATPDLPATIFVMKPRDSTIERFIKAFGYKVVRDWPPKVIKVAGHHLTKKPPGYVLWPVETGNPDYDDAWHKRIFQRALRMMYSAGGKRGKKHQPSIIFADETYSLENELGLKADLQRIWTKGRSVGVGLWAGSQRPVWISRWALQAQHLFLGNDPDVEMQKRYGEIGGGIDPEIVRSLVAQLKRYQFLYINREERTICIVDAS